MGEAREVISGRYGLQYVMPRGRVYKTKTKGAQEAHEAIRPTSFARDPDSLGRACSTPSELRLYRLIWQRALASQMAPKELETTTVDLTADGYGLRATATRTIFDGFAAVYTEGTDDPASDDGGGQLPALAEGDRTSVARCHAEPALHPAAAALHGGGADQGARGARHRPAVDLRRDHLDDHRSRLRQGRRAAAAARAGRRGRDRPAGRALRRVRRRRLHRAHGGGARRGRRAASATGCRCCATSTARSASSSTEKRSELQAQRLHHRGDRRGLLGGPPDGHPPRAATAASWPARSIPSTRRRGRCPGEEPEMPAVEGVGEVCPECGQGTLVAQARPLRAFRRLLALSRLQVHPQDRPAAARAARHSRSPAPSAARATWSRGARAGRAASSGAARAIRSATSPRRASRLGALHDADDGPVAREGESGAICLKCGAPIELPEGRCRGQKLPGGEPNPEALAAPRRRSTGRRASRGRSPSSSRSSIPPRRRLTGGRLSHTPRDRRRGARRVPRPARRPRRVPHTLRAYRTAVEPVPRAGWTTHGHDWRAPGRHALRAYLAELADRGLSSRARSAAASRHCARSTGYARREGSVEGDPWAAVLTPRLPRRLPQVMRVA